jgi:Holliday junction resolvase YEN1
LGIVDAVWSDDGDTLMFGCNTLIRTYYEKGKGSGAKSATHVKLYETHHIRQRHGLGKLDKHGMVLIALLSGGDYDQTGIKGCGPRMALEAVQNGLAEPFKYSYFQRTEIHQWQAQMIGFLSRKAVEIPPIFPNQKALNYYRNPTVSTDSALLDLAQRWLIPQINEANLRLLLRSRFNIQTKAYIQHIIPIWVTKALREKLFDSHHSHGIELVSAGGRKKTEKVEQQYEQKIKYHPVAFTTLDLSVAPQGEFGEDWKPGFDAREITDCEVLEVLLQHGAPEACHKANEQVAKKKQSSTRKRKSKSDEDIATSNSSPKRQKGDNLATSGKSNISGCYKHQSKDTVQKNTKSGITVSRFRPPPPLSLNMIENDDSVNQSEQDFDSEHNSSFPQCVGAGNLSNPIVIDLTDD